MNPSSPSVDGADADAPAPSMAGCYIAIDVRQSAVLEWVRERWPDRCDPTSRTMKLGEEAGEVIGAVVKMGEGRKTKDDLATELAQLVMCAKGLAASAGIDLELAVLTEWVDMQSRVWPSQPSPSTPIEQESDER